MKGNDYRAWVQYAQNDLSVAIREMERTSHSGKRPFEVILYHCQQSAEKMLKAYLLYKGTIEWGHDLDSLRIKCTALDSAFSSSRIARHCAFLSMFATVRYPDFTFSVDSSHSTRGINSAKRVYDFVSDKLALGKVYFT